MPTLPLRSPEGLWNLERLTGEPRIALALAQHYGTWQELAASPPPERWTRVGPWAVAVTVPHHPIPVPACPGRWAIGCFDGAWPHQLHDDVDTAAVLWGFGHLPSGPAATVVVGAHATPEGRARARRAARAVHAEGAALVATTTSPLAGDADVLVCAGDPTRVGTHRAAVLAVLDRGGAVVWSTGPGAPAGPAEQDRANRLAVTFAAVAVAADVAPHHDGGGLAAATALRLGRPVVALPVGDGSAPVEAFHRSLAADGDWARALWGLDPKAPPAVRGDDRLAAALTARLR